MADVSDRYERINEQSTKRISIVVRIDGLSEVLTNRPLYTRMRYGDPVQYGDPGLVYGGLRPLTGQFRSYLSLTGSALTLSQRVEPEQGKSSISGITLAFIDKDGYMSQLVAPGIVFPEILGRGVEVWLGYEELSYPDDFFRAFRGFITGVDPGMGVVSLRISDPNVKRRRELFYSAKTRTTARVDYHSRVIQDLAYVARDGHGTDVSIRYIGGDTAGSESVSVTGKAITVSIESGVSTASQVRSAIEEHAKARTLVEISTVGDSNNPQVTVGATSLQDATEIQVASNSDFHRTILGPDGTSVEGIRNLVKIDDEWIEVAPNEGDATKFTIIERGVTLAGERSYADPHDAETEVTAGIEINDDALTMALRLMLSGWNGAWTSDVPITAIGPEIDPNPVETSTELVTLPLRVDAIRDYGLSEGDYFMISGSAHVANNGTWFRISAIEAQEDQENRVLRSETALTKEALSGATLSFRSQFDVYPTTAGLKLTPKDVDVARHIFIRDTYLSFDENSYEFVLTEAETSGKEFIESELYLPAGCYSLTRQGRLSVGITKPPLAEEQLRILSSANILNPKSLIPKRSMTGRGFWNEIQYHMDETLDGKFSRIVRIVDSESLSLIDQPSALAIKSRGSRSSTRADVTLDRIATLMLNRYKRGAVMFDDVQTNWGTGHLIEPGDIVALVDDGDLKISNPGTGDRGLGTKLFEVTNQEKNLGGGNVKLSLVGGLDGRTDDRYGTISPSSEIDAGSTVNRLRIRDSFGAIFEGNEPRKWKDYIGEMILVHDEEWDFEAETRLMGFDPQDPYVMLVEPNLPWVPAEGYIVDIPNYPESTSTLDNGKYKAIHAFLSSTVIVTAGVDDRTFEVDPADIAKFFVGAIVQVHEEEYDADGGDSIVESVDLDNNRVVLEESIGFTPLAGYEVDLIGFADKKPAYRWI